MPATGPSRSALAFWGWSLRGRRPSVRPWKCECSTRSWSWWPCWRRSNWVRENCPCCGRRPRNCGMAICDRGEELFCPWTWLFISFLCFVRTIEVSFTGRSRIQKKFQKNSFSKNMEVLIRGVNQLGSNVYQTIAGQNKFFSYKRSFFLHIKDPPPPNGSIWY